MIRRRPIARMAVRTTVVAGTAAAIGARAAGNRAAAAAAPEPPPMQSGSPDPIEQLTKLAALKDSGALTEEEFAAQKAKLLG